MSLITVTQSTVGGTTGGGGYVDAGPVALPQGTTFAFSTTDVTNNAFFIARGNTGLAYTSLHGADGTLTPGQTVLLVKVNAQIDG